MDNLTVVGTPSPLLLSAKRWGWKYVSGPHAIDLSMECSVVGAPGVPVYVKAVSFNEADDIDIRINFGSILKTMFSDSSYPKLKETEVFSISDVLVDKKKSVITVVGNILEKVTV